MDKFLFDNIGSKIKIFAKVLFYVAIVVGIISLIFGFFMLCEAAESEYVSWKNAWYITAEKAENYPSLYEYGYRAASTMKRGFWLIISSVVAIPTYAFGELLYSCQEIRKNTEAMISKEKE